MYVTDNLGSVVASIDSSGHGVLTDPYTAYGLDAQAGSLDPMFTFTGALQDTVGTTTPGTGFLHLGNRWYSPPVEPNAGVGNQVGPAHFTQSDSLTQLASPANGNLYAYAADSPVNYVDPTGACSLSSIFGFSSGIVGGFGTALGTWILAGSVSVPSRSYHRRNGLGRRHPRRSRIGPMPGGFLGRGLLMQRLVIFIAVVVICAAVIVDVTAVPLLLKVLVTCVTLGFAGLVVKSMLADRSKLIMPAFMIALRGYDIAEVDRLIAKGEEAAASDDPEVRKEMKAELGSVHLRRRIRGYAPHQVDRAIKDLMARLG